VSEREALIAVWNASQNGDVRALGIPMQLIKRLIEQELLQGWKSEQAGKFVMVTEHGKQFLGVSNGR